MANGKASTYPYFLRRGARTEQARYLGHAWLALVAGRQHFHPRTACEFPSWCCAGLRRRRRRRGDGGCRGRNKTSWIRTRKRTYQPATKLLSYCVLAVSVCTHTRCFFRLVYCRGEIKVAAGGDHVSRCVLWHRQSLYFWGIFFLQKK